MDFERFRAVSRRDFVTSAVAIGGTSALAACQDRERAATETGADGDGGEDDDALDLPRPEDPSDRPNGLHRWNDYLVRNAHGNTVLPRHQVVLGLSYEGSVPPTDEEREQVEAALRTLDRAYQWGTSGNQGASLSNGLLWMLGYSQRYFDRLDADPDPLLSPEEVLDAVGEDASLADPFDAVLVLNADYGSVAMAPEHALWGETDQLNGVEVEATLEGVFSRETRRTGITGKGVVARELDNEDVPEEAPLSMGYRSGFADNQAPEDRATIDDGPFAGGSTLAVSRLHIDLDRWYDQDTEERAAEMFCPAHDLDEVGETAEQLGTSSRITPEDAESVEEHAEEYGRIGHSQKVARARDDDFVPKIIRRSEGVATDVAEGAGFNFTSIQADVQDFVEVRKAMHTEEYDVDLDADDHGIVDYLETKARTALIVPPRERVALPEP
ncbi:DUF7405 family protein [Halomicrobium urmianum]|uniref:DUF7405 family protein n=1 Tax=Halomicrobium urmianum TaxID=1586233 RepID=UPI001CDA0E48|nr:hypothetical protein [Halomicrobium urmianum]